MCYCFTCTWLFFSRLFLFVLLIWIISSIYFDDDTNISLFSSGWILFECVFICLRYTIYKAYESLSWMKLAHECGGVDLKQGWCQNGVHSSTFQTNSVLSECLKVWTNVWLRVHRGLIRGLMYDLMHVGPVWDPPLAPALAIHNLLLVKVVFWVELELKVQTRMKSYIFVVRTMCW